MKNFGGINPPVALKPQKNPNLITACITNLSKAESDKNYISRVEVEVQETEIQNTNSLIPLSTIYTLEEINNSDTATVVDAVCQEFLKRSCPKKLLSWFQTC